MKFDHPRGLRQSMSWLHTWSGLVLGWLLFAIFVTGTLSFFRNEITFWMQPELHKASREPIAFDRILQVLEREAPGAAQWSLTLPGPRNPTLGLSWQSAAGGENRAAGGENRSGRGAATAESAARREDSASSRRTDSVAPSAAPGERRARMEGARASGGGEGMARQRQFREEGAQGMEEEKSGAPARGERRARAQSNPAESGEGPPRQSRGEGARSADFNPRQGEATRPNQERMEAQARQGGTQQQRAQGGGGGFRGPRVMLDPASGEKLTGRETAGGNFLYRFHFELHGMDRIWGRWIVGIATMCMLVAIITGVIVHRHIFKDFFTFRPGKGKRSWLDAHNASSVLSLPFHIMITFSGLLLFGNMLFPSAIQSAYGDSNAYMQEMRGRMTMAETPRPSGERAPLTDLAPLVAAAEETWNGRRAGSISIFNPGDRRAVIELRQSMIGANIVTGRSATQTLRFDGVSGRPLDVVAPPPPSTVQSIYNVFMMLHRGFFASPIPRWLLFLGGVGGSLMVASGLVMWSVARAKEKEKTGRVPFGHRLVEVFNIAGIAGLLVATGAYFWANRLIPADLSGRNEWEIAVFFYAWAFSAVHALVRKYRAAWMEQLILAGVLIALLPVLNAQTGGLSLFGSIYLSQWLLAGFDSCALVTGGALFYAAYRVHRHFPAARRAHPRAGGEIPPEMPRAADTGADPDPGTETEKPPMAPEPGLAPSPLLQPVFPMLQTEET